MGSSEYCEGLRHKPRHNAGDAGKVPDDMGFFELKLIGWGVPREHPDVDAIRIRLGRVWRRLPDPDRFELLRAAEAIAEVEAAKAAWNPKADEGRRRELRGLAQSAVKLVREIHLFLPPRVGEDRRDYPGIPAAPTGSVRDQLLANLASLAEGTLLATKPFEKVTSAYMAAWNLRRAKRRLVARTGNAHFELLADLAWLASGMRYKISERSLRRYPIPGGSLIFNRRYLGTHLSSMGSGRRAAQKAQKGLISAGTPEALKCFHGIHEAHQNTPTNSEALCHSR